MGCSSMVNGGKSGLFFKKQIRISLHCRGLRDILFLPHHWLIPSRVVCNIDSWFLVRVSKRDESSTYFHLSSQFTNRSLIIIMNKIGPKSTPPFTGSNLDRNFPIDKPASDPNCFLSTRCLTCDIIHSATKWIVIFDRMGVKDIGRKSFSSTLTATDLGMGITSASFHKSGTILSCINALKKIL